VTSMRTGSGAFWAAASTGAGAGALLTAGRGAGAGSNGVVAANGFCGGSSTSTIAELTVGAGVTAAGAGAAAGRGIFGTTVTSASSSTIGAASERLWARSARTAVSLADAGTLSWLWEASEQVLLRQLWCASPPHWRTIQYDTIKNANNDKPTARSDTILNSHP
jgi:hypothetical protein